MAPLVKGAAYVLPLAGFLLALGARHSLWVWRTDPLAIAAVAVLATMTLGHWASPDVLKSVEVHARTALVFIALVGLNSARGQRPQGAPSTEIWGRWFLGTLVFASVVILLLRFPFFGGASSLLAGYGWILGQDLSQSIPSTVGKGSVNLMAVLLPVVCGLALRMGGLWRVLAWGCVVGVCAALFGETPFLGGRPWDINSTAVISLSGGLAGAAALGVLRRCGVNYRDVAIGIGLFSAALLGGCFWMLSTIEVPIYEVECRGTECDYLDTHKPDRMPVVGFHREALWGLSWQQIKINPWYGGGLDSFDKGPMKQRQQVHFNGAPDGDYARQHGINLMSTHPHNAMIELVLEAGWMAGLGAAVCVVWLFLRWLRRFWGGESGWFFGLWGLLNVVSMSMSAHSVWHMVWLSVCAGSLVLCSWLGESHRRESK